MVDRADLADAIGYRPGRVLAEEVKQRLDNGLTYWMLCGKLLVLMPAYGRCQLTTQELSSSASAPTQKMY